MAQNDTNQPADQTSQSAEAAETKRRKKATPVADNTLADTARETTSAGADGAEKAIDAAVHATTGVTGETEHDAEKLAGVGADAVSRAMEAGRAAAAGLAAAAEAPRPRAVAGAAFPPAVATGSATNGAAKAAKAGSDQLTAAAGELSEQLSSLLEDNGELFERLTQARSVPAVMSAYQSWMVKRMGRAAGLNWAIWNAWTRTVQSSISSQPGPGR